MSVELTDAIEAVKSHKRGYEQIRQGIDLLAMTRARADFGMAYLNLIDMFVAKAEAEDQRDPAWAARGAGRKKLAGTKPHDNRLRDAWDYYQASRKSGDDAAITGAREAWRQAFVAWLQDSVAEMAREDDRHVEELQRRLDEAGRLDPDDAFPAPPGSRVEALVRASRERERERRVTGDKMRGYGGLQAWRPAGR
jgi:hypothetical protein